MELARARAARRAASASVRSSVVLPLPARAVDEQAAVPLEVEVERALALERRARRAGRAPRRRRVGASGSGATRAARTGSSGGSHGDGCGAVRRRPRPPRRRRATIRVEVGLRRRRRRRRSVRGAAGRRSASVAQRRPSAGPRAGRVSAADVRRLELGQLAVAGARERAARQRPRGMRAASGAPITSALSRRLVDAQRDAQVRVRADVLADDAAAGAASRARGGRRGCGRAGRRRRRRRRTPGTSLGERRELVDHDHEARRARAAGSRALHARAGPSRPRRASTCSRRSSSAFSETSARCVRCASRSVTKPTVCGSPTHSLNAAPPL